MCIRDRQLAWVIAAVLVTALGASLYQTADLGIAPYDCLLYTSLFKALAQKNGLILLTDSDAAGFRIRTYITNLVGEKNVVQAYVPADISCEDQRWHCCYWNRGGLGSDETVE